MENRVIKFRAFKDGKMYPVHTLDMYSHQEGKLAGFSHPNDKECIDLDDAVFMQYVNVVDNAGIEIYEGDVLEFADKWEWYKTSYGIKMRFAEPEIKAELQKQYDAEPMERRVIEMPECYEWILSSEIQTYWRVIGNKFQHANLLNQTP